MRLGDVARLIAIGLVGCGGTFESAAPTDAAGESAHSPDAGSSADASVGVDAAADRVPTCLADSGPIGWSVWPGPLPAATLRGVWGSSSHDVWAVGDLAAASSVTTLLHWDGSTWSLASAPMSLALTSVWGFSPTDAWAVGSSGDHTGVILHWDGTSWSVSLAGVMAGPTTLTQHPVPLYAVWGLSSDDVWATGGNLFNFNGGSFLESCPTVMLHWNGMAWSPIPLPPFPSWVFSGVGGTSSVDVWAGGVSCFAGHSTELSALHWDGLTWTENETGFPSVPGTSIVQGALSGVASIGSSVWAAGVFFDEGVDAGSPPQYSLARWNGSAWTDFVYGHGLNGIWSANATFAWAVGGQGSILGWNGAQWAPAMSGTNVDLIGVWGTGVTEAWAVGGTRAPSPSGIILHCGGQ